MSQPTDTFLQEAGELLETLEQDLLELEADPARPALVDQVFRALHTIKGSGEMFGFSALARFVHHFENAYERVRSGKAAVTPDLITISLDSRDHIARLLEAGRDEEATGALEASPTHAALLARIEGFGGASAPARAAAADPAEPARVEKTWSIWFRPEPGALRNGMRPDLLIEELAGLGVCRARCTAREVPPLEELDPTACLLGWRIELTTDAGRERIDDIFLFFDDGDIEIAEAGPPRPAAAPAADRPARSEQPAASEPEGRAAAARSESIRVQSHRLDELMDQLGELVIAQARLNQISEHLGDTALASAAEEIERLVTGMRDATLSIRMLPIGGVFGKFRRVVRDLSSELGKTVQLVTEGGDTELDKNVIDRLTDPLVHIIRNAVDHGIEKADARRAAGKPATATVRMMARQTGGEVLISVTDDGGGLHTDAIRAKAIERGLIDPQAEIPDAEIHQLIFAPGFSTATVISSVSGRGVGMDAVRRFIEDLRGAVEVRSHAGKGTEVTLRMPLTLAIIDGLLVRVSTGVFVIPLASVEECVELPESEARRPSGRALLDIRNELVPYLMVNDIFRFDRHEDSLDRVVIVNVDGRRVGLVVDDIVGQHQTVIKSLGAFHRNVPGLAGCTILGDGSVALIMDPAALIKSMGPRNRDAA